MKPIFSFLYILYICSITTGDWTMIKTIFYNILCYILTFGATARCDEHRIFKNNKKHILFVYFLSSLIRHFISFVPEFGW